MWKGDRKANAEGMGAAAWNTWQKMLGWQSKDNVGMLSTGLSVSSLVNRIISPTHIKNFMHSAFDVSHWCRYTRRKYFSYPTPKTF